MFTPHACLPIAILVGWACVLTGPIAAEDASEIAFFEKKIRPALVKYCYECHAADADQVGGKLMLDLRSSLLSGGESGPALVAGQPDKSLIVQALRYEDLEMPPDQPLPESVVNDFVQWVSRGAADPRDDPTTDSQNRYSGEIKFDRESMWSFLPPSNPVVPEVQQPDWPHDPIDRFVLRRIEDAGLQPANDAEPGVLLRRLYYDLIGLPPTFPQITAFATDHRLRGGTAVESVVDSLLQSPQFGERWGRHWLDVARYAESNGNDGLGRNASFPHAWRYRDYVIDALNRDVPYDRFITEQIAGDLLPAETAEQRNRQLVATGFLAIGSKPAAAMNTNFAMDVVDDQINAVCTTVMGLSVACARCHDHKHDPIPTRDYYSLAGIFSSSKTLYGLAANEKLTAPPTELHELRSDWKKEDVPQSKNSTPIFADGYRDAIETADAAAYYSFKVAAEPLQVKGKASYSTEAYAAVKDTILRGDFPSQSDSYSVGFWFKNNTKNSSRPITAYLFSRATVGDKDLIGDHLGIGGTHDKARTGKLFVFSGNKTKKSAVGTTVLQPGSWNHVMLIRTPKRVKLFLNGNIEIDDALPSTFGDRTEYCVGMRSDNFSPMDGNLAHLMLFDRAVADSQAGVLYDASGQHRRVPSEVALAMGVLEKDKPTDCKIHIKGEGSKLGPIAPRGFLTAYHAAEEQSGRSADASPNKFAIGKKESGRRQLAAWLTNPEHPQTSRVIVNRIWLHLFGRGIVTTPDDFGVYGTRPSDPALLDHLAQRFVAQGWSIKQLIRTIVLSRVYGLDSHCDSELRAADPDNVMFAYHDRRRLDAETLRDSMLAVSRQLDRRPGQGSAVEKVVALINWPPGESTNLHRPSQHRSVYLCMLRHAPPPELAAFDLPDAVGIAGQRNETMLPTQSLYLLNGPFVLEQANALAAQLLSSDQGDDVQRVRIAFQRVLCRGPSDGEAQQALKYLSSIEQSLAAGTEASVSGTEMSVREAAWTSFCQALLCTNEFRYID